MKNKNNALRMRISRMDDKIISAKMAYYGQLLKKWVMLVDFMGIDAAYKSEAVKVLEREMDYLCPGARDPDTGLFPDGDPHGYNPVTDL